MYIMSILSVTGAQSSQFTTETKLSSNLYDDKGNGNIFYCINVIHCFMSTSYIWDSITIVIAKVKAMYIGIYLCVMACSKSLFEDWLPIVLLLKASHFYLLA